MSGDQADVAVFTAIPPVAQDYFAKFASDAAATYAAELRLRAALLASNPDQARREALEAVYEATGGEFYALAAYATLGQLDERLERGSGEIVALQAETARTDKQVGASPGTSGTTSLVAKPGTAALLALALENGVIQQESNETSVTFRSSPYSLAILGRHDDIDAYERYGGLQRLGVSASFALGSDAGDRANGLSSETLSNVGARLRLYGDRNPRSRRFVDAWREKVAGIATRVLDEQNATLLPLLGANGPLRPVAERSQQDFEDRLRQRVTGPAAESLDVELTVKESAWTAICENVIVDYQAGRIAISPETEAELVPAYRRMIELQGQKDAALAEVLTDFNKRPLVTADYLFFNTAGGSDYSEVKLLANGVWDSRALGPLSFDLNATVSFYHSPDRALGQTSVRDYSGVLGIQRAFDVSGARLFRNSDDLSPATIALNGRVSHLEEIDDIIGNVQLRFEWPLATGLSVPISLNWMSRTETVNEDAFRIAIGLSLDADKMSALSRFAAAMAQ